MGKFPVVDVVDRTGGSPVRQVSNIQDVAACRALDAWPTDPEPKDVIEWGGNPLIVLCCRRDSRSGQKGLNWSARGLAAWVWAILLPLCSMPDIRCMCALLTKQQVSQEITSASLSNCCSGSTHRRLCVQMHEFRRTHLRLQRCTGTPAPHSLPARHQTPTL